MDAYPIESLDRGELLVTFEDFIVFFYNCFGDWVAEEFLFPIK